MKLTRRQAAAAFAATLSPAPAVPNRRREPLAVWAHPSDAGNTVESVRRLVDQCGRAHVSTIVMLVKHTTGAIYWKSKRFARAIAKGYENFDLIEHLAREAHARGIQFHAWLCDFVEGEQGAAFREHPEWAQLDAGSKTTLSERREGGQGYGYVAMCPARRPGYTDQWLLPMIEEVAANYPVDGIHHDYVRYTGDIAPDSYCFCDYCIEDMPRHALLKWETGPRERQRMEMMRPRVEANWEGTPDMVPAGWAQMDRREKADFLYYGGSLAGGPRDMLYYFYEYRVDQTNRFVRDAWKRAQRINPKIEISAAVFKNPIQSARYIGQKWNDWTPWVDVFMPMSYRSHFHGDFEAYLTHLTEITVRQREWLGGEKRLYAGIATAYLYKEEAPGNYPPEKFARAIEAARRATPDGIAIFSAAGLTMQKLWPVLEESFKD